MRHYYTGYYEDDKIPNPSFSHTGTTLCGKEGVPWWTYKSQEHAYFLTRSQINWILLLLRENQIKKLPICPECLNHPKIQFLLLAGL